MYYSEISKIIEAGLECDKERVRNFASLLMKKMKEDGEERGCISISNVLNRNKAGKAVPDSLGPLPVDQESRMSIVDVDYQPNEELLVLSEPVSLKLQVFIDSIRNKATIDNMGLVFSQTLLLYGYPGCGKTSVASFVAAKMHLPLVTAKLDSLVSSLLGATAKNIHKVFEFAKKQPCVLFLDEFDAIAKARDDQYELGELKRVVNSLLQNIDSFCEEGILIAATNHQELLDNAIWRRFQTVIEMPRPTVIEIKKMMDLMPEFLDVDSITDNQWKKIYHVMEGLSYSDIKRIINSISRKAVLNQKTILGMEDIIAEVFLFRVHGDYSKDELALFMLKSAVPKKRIVSFSGLSRRHVDYLESGMIENK